MLLWFVIIYWVISVAIGLYAATRVHNSKASIFKMVENAYQITLVVAFVPLVCGLYWRRATNQGALAAIFAAWLPGYPSCWWTAMILSCRHSSPASSRRRSVWLPVRCYHNGYNTIRISTTSCVTAITPTRPPGPTMCR